MVMYKVYIPSQEIYVEAEDEIDAEINAVLSGDISVRSVEEVEDGESED